MTQKPIHATIQHRHCLGGSMCECAGMDDERDWQWLDVATKELGAWLEANAPGVTIEESADEVDAMTYAQDEPDDYPPVWFEARFVLRGPVSWIEDDGELEFSTDSADWYATPSEDDLRSFILTAHSRQ